jgi:hypothetical protein
MAVQTDIHGDETETVRKLQIRETKCLRGYTPIDHQSNKEIRERIKGF